MLFMGEEWSEPAPFLYFVSHGDPELCAAVQKGRKEEFAAFHAQGEAPDPVSEDTFLQSKLQWQLLNETPHQSMLNYYKALISLRKSQPALYNLDRKNLHVETDEEKNLLVLHRWTNEQHLICVMNFSKRQQSFMPPSNVQRWQKVFDSASPEWLGPQSAPAHISGGAPGSSAVTMQPESIVIYADSHSPLTIHHSK